MKRYIILFVIVFAAVSAFCLEKYVDADLVRTASAPRMLDEGFLFTLPPDTGYMISLRMNADNWQKDYTFRRNMYNVWYLYMPYNDIANLTDAKSLLYKLNINGFWDNDPQNPNYIYDRFHDKISYLRIPEEKDNAGKKMPLITDAGSKLTKKVTFKYYNPDAKEVGLVCSDTNMAIFSHSMALDKFGYWSLDLSFGRGVYYYYFLADWEKVLDDLNPDSARDKDIGAVNVFYVE